ncbi:MAG: hypothetical protein AAF648_14475 [Pseudomonadota bacterium]
MKSPTEDAEHSILFLHPDQPEATPHSAVGGARARAAHDNDNGARIPQAFAAAGWQVSHAPVASLRLSRDLLCAAGPVRRFHRIWILGFGPARSFLDRMQMLSLLPSDRFVTSPEALLLLHGKVRWLEHMPETHISNDPDFLFACTGRGGDWILKPVAGSFGRGVRRLQGVPAGVGDQAQREALASLLKRATAAGEYWVLQRFMPDIATGETRILCSGGQLLGYYLRQPVLAIDGQGNDRPPLANRSAGAEARAVELTQDQRTLARKIANDLLALGVGFAAIDLVGSTLIEVNVANPGGLARIETLNPERQATARLVAALEELWT